MLAEMYPSALLGTNGLGELPVETEIRHGQDDVAAFLTRKMDHRRFVHLLRKIKSPSKLWLSKHHAAFCFFNATKR